MGALKKRSLWNLSVLSSPRYQVLFIFYVNYFKMLPLSIMWSSYNLSHIPSSNRTFQNTAGLFHPPPPHNTLWLVIFLPWSTWFILCSSSFYNLISSFSPWTQLLLPLEMAGGHPLSFFTLVHIFLFPYNAPYLILWIWFSKRLKSLLEDSNSPPAPPLVNYCLLCATCVP